VSLSDILQPAITLAEDGFAVGQMASHEWRSHEGLLQQVAAGSGPDYPFLVEGKAPLPGQFFSNPALAKTLRKIGTEGKGAYYEGPIAEAIVQAIQSRGGLMTLEDLAAHETDFVEPIKYTYTSGGKDAEGLTVHECPPNGQGLAALIALGILDVLQEDGVIDLQATQEGSAEWYHTLIEAVRLAFADAHAYIADPTVVKVPTQELLSKVSWVPLWQGHTLTHRRSTSVSAPNCSTPQRQLPNTTRADRSPTATRSI
jgi:gamma-glutamyltranspeptidase/glutathione hydrolase